MQELGKEKALVKTVARILNLKVDALWGRHRRRQKRRRLLAGIAATAAALVAATAGYLYFAHYREKTNYYADYIEKWGVPEGIIQLSEEQIEHRNYSWKIVSSQGKVRRISCINGSGHLRTPTDTEESHKPVDRIFSYHDNGKVSGVVENDTTGKKVKHWDFSNDLSVVEFVAGAGRKSMQSVYFAAKTTGLDASSESYGAKSEIVAWELAYDHSGRVLKRHYLKNGGHSTKDANGVGGLEFEYTPENQLSRIQYLSINNKPMATTRGVAGKLYQYDKAGNRIKTSWINLSNQPVTNADQYSVVVQSYDAHGNVIQETYLGTKEQPVMCRNDFYKLRSRVKINYQTLGEIT